jgi:transcriptional regulator GlxA family with amidase domain
MEIVVLAYPGFDELDVVGPYRVFAGAADTVDLSVSIRTLESTERVTASKGLTIEPVGVLGDADPDLVVVPGGGWNDRSEESAWAEAERGVIPEAVAGLHERGVTIASVCTGGMLLERAGLLDDRPAVTHQGAMDDLRDSDAEVVEARVVDDGEILTAGGVTSGIDLALYILEREFGAEVAEDVATTLEYERRGSVALE